MESTLPSPWKKHSQASLTKVLGEGGPPKESWGGYCESCQDPVIYFINIMIFKKKISSLAPGVLGARPSLSPLKLVFFLILFPQIPPHRKIFKKTLPPPQTPYQIPAPFQKRKKRKPPQFWGRQRKNGFFWGGGGKMTRLAPWKGPPFSKFLINKKTFWLFWKTFSDENSEIFIILRVFGP